MSSLVLLPERVKSMIDNCILRRFATCKEMSNYNTYYDNVSSNFVGQMPDVILKEHQKVTHCWKLEEIKA